MKLAIIGYGKMGKRIEKLSPHYGFFDIVTIDNEDDWLTKNNEIASCDIAIEFSTPETALLNLQKCFDLQIPVISGTTGWSDRKDEFFKQLNNNSISFVYGSNFSIGANLFFKLNECFAQQMKLQPQYDISIEETHHIHKKDAPSGTAITIKDIINNQTNQNDIPIISHREGEVVGEHIVTYKSEEDFFQLKHAALSRDMFAHGALKAAVWLLIHPGIYAFENIFEKV